jgi:hypothetical protein
MSQAGTYNAIGIIPTSTQFVTDVGGPVGVVGGVVNIIGGTGIQTVGIGPNTIQINSTGQAILAWTREAGPAVAMVVNHGYIPTAVVTFTLPLVSAIGDVITILAEDLFTIQCNAGQSIQSSANTTSVAGHIDSTNDFDSITIVCRIANTTWGVTSSNGIFNYL